MLDFIKNYPFKYYVKTLFKFNKPADVFYYINQKTTVMLKYGKEIMFNPNLCEAEGAPGDSILDPEKSDITRLKGNTPYNQSMLPIYGLQNGENTNVVLHTDDTFLKKIEKIQLPSDLKNALVNDIQKVLQDTPGRLMPEFKNMNAEIRYSWIILNENLEPLNNNDVIPSSCFIAGIASARCDLICQWIESWLGNPKIIMPGSLAILQTFKKILNNSGFIIFHKDFEQFAGFYNNSKWEYFTFSKDYSKFSLEDLSEQIIEFAEAYAADVPNGKIPLYYWGDDKIFFNQIKTFEGIQAINVDIEYLESVIPPVNDEKNLVPEAWILNFLKGVK